MTNHRREAEARLSWATAPRPASLSEISTTPEDATMA